MNEILKWYLLGKSLLKILNDEKKTRSKINTTFYTKNLMWLFLFLPWDRRDIYLK